MSAAIKDVVVVAISQQEDQGALTCAECLARAYDAHVAALIVAVHPGSIFAREEAPLSEVLTDLARGSRGEAALRQKEIRAWIAQRGVPFEVRTLEVEDALHDQKVLAHARHADVTVMTKPISHEDVARQAIWQSVLFRSGRPVLLTPRNWLGDSVGRRILVAWNAKREGVRAVADAMPLIAAAEHVAVTTIDATPSAEGHGDRPGHDLTLHLARHGAKAEVMNVDGLGRPAGVRLLEVAREWRADMIVMGGYGHARAAEWLLGGVTRDIIGLAEIPVLMSH